MRHDKRIRGIAVIAAAFIAAAWLAPAASAHPRISIAISVPGVVVSTGNYYPYPGYWPTARVYYGVPVYHVWRPGYYGYRYARPGYYRYDRYHRHYHHRDNRARHWRRGHYQNH